jgi:hypothetical protein
MTNQIRPLKINSLDACHEKDLNCRKIVHREVENMTNNITNNQSKLKIFGMIITVPMILMGNIHPVLSIGLSQQLEIANSQSSFHNSLVSQPVSHNQNNYFDANRIGVANQLTTAKTIVLESGQFSQKSEPNALEVFLTSGYYSKDCRRRKVCDD